VQILAIAILTQVLILVFDCPPQPLDEHVVQRPPTTMRADAGTTSAKPKAARGSLQINPLNRRTLSAFHASSG
jgi:hypothetical protein